MIFRCLRRQRSILLPVANLMLLAGCAAEPSPPSAPQPSAASAQIAGIDPIYPLQPDVSPGQVWVRSVAQHGGQTVNARILARLPQYAPAGTDHAARSAAGAAPREDTAAKVAADRSGATVLAPSAGPRLPRRRTTGAADQPAMLPYAASPLLPPLVAPAGMTMRAGDPARRPVAAGPSRLAAVRLLEARLAAGGPLEEIRTALGFDRADDAVVALSVPSSRYVQADQRDVRRDAENFIQCNPQIFNRGHLLAAQGQAASERGAQIVPVVVIPTTVYYTTTLDYTFRPMERTGGVRPYTETRAAAAGRSNAELLQLMLRENPDLRARLDQAVRERTSHAATLAGATPGLAGRSITLTTHFDRPVAWAYLGLSYEIHNDRTTLSDAEARYCQALGATATSLGIEPPITPDLLYERSTRMRPAARPAQRMVFESASQTGAARQVAQGGPADRPDRSGTTR